MVVLVRDRSAASKYDRPESASRGGFGVRRGKKWSPRDPELQLSDTASLTLTVAYKFRFGWKPSDNGCYM